MPEMLTVKEAAEKLKTSPEYVRGKIHSNEIKATNVGTEKRPRYRVSIKVVDKFIEDRTVIGIQEDK